MVTLVERSKLVIKIIVGMCMYLRYKFTGRFACMRLRVWPAGNIVGALYYKL